MQVNTTDANAASGFYATSFEVFAQTLEESIITRSVEMGGGVVIHHGTRDGDSVWLMDNPYGKFYGIWLEENGQLAN